MLTLPLMFASLGACGSDADNPPSTGAAGSSNPDGDGSEHPSETIELPDPGTPPKSAAGMVTISVTQGNDGAQSFTGTAVFLSPNNDLTAPDFKMLLDGYSEVELDTCFDLNKLPKFSSSGSQQSLLDVGVVQIRSPSKSVHSFKKQTFFDFTTYDATWPMEAFQPGGEYNLGASGGGGLGQFVGSFWAPGSLTLDQPALPTAALQPVPRDEPFELRWSGEPDGRPVNIYVDQPGETQGKSWVCRVIDDGEFSVPVEVLSTFDAGVGSGEGGAKAHISVRHENWYAIGSASGGAASLVLFDSGATLDVTFQ